MKQNEKHTLKKPKAKKPPKSIRRIRKKIGDVIEVPTSKGLAYVQYTHQHKDPPVFWSLIRVLQGFYKKRPSMEELGEVVDLPHRFQTFCPVYRVVNIGDFDRVGNFLVPASSFLPAPPSDEGDADKNEEPGSLRGKKNGSSAVS